MSKISSPRPVRRRRAPEEVRAEALAVARRLLLEQGPEAITLKAVGDALGMTHANLIHHFGSADRLQGELMRSMVDDLAVALVALVEEVQRGHIDDRAVVEAVFDAFDQGGAGRLAAWIALSKDDALFDAFRPAVAMLAKALADRHVDEGPALNQSILLTALLALGDSLLGRFLCGVLHLPEDSTRSLTTTLLASFTPPPRLPADGEN
jgi:AcrR family transcriptional regulator